MHINLHALCALQRELLHLLMCCFEDLNEKLSGP